MIKLPDFLKYKSAPDLIRIGRETDGGYLVSEQDIMDTNVLISFGINDDWSFERDFLNLNKVKLISADGSVGLDVFLKRFLKSIVFFRGFLSLWTNYKIYKSFKNFFFTENVVHFQKFVGYDMDPNFYGFDYFFQAAGNSSNVFLKIDIEGSEYRILEKIIESQNQISGIVIEFHDFDLHHHLVESFIKNVKLHIIHIHANNCSPVNVINGLPHAVEITFSRRQGVVENFTFPHQYDKPNNPGKKDLILSF